MSVQGLSRLLMLLEPGLRPPGPRSPARLALLDGVVSIRQEPDGWWIRVQGPDVAHEIRVDERYRAAVAEGEAVQAGDALTYGSRRHRDLRRVAGPERYGEHVARELEIVFAMIGSPLDSRVIDLLVRAQVEELAGPAG